VLPLATNTNDQNTQFLGDGITDSLIDSLSQIPHFKVMSRSSVFHYKGRDADPQAVGRELQVKAVLTGRLVQKGDHLFLSTELVNVSDNSHIWGDEYDRKVSDILPLQQELAHTIAEKLRFKLSSEQQQKIAKQGTQNPEAYGLYVRGLHAFDKASGKDFKEGVDLFQQATNKDPTYAAAYAGMAESYALLGFGAMPVEEARPKALAAAKRAIELDDSLAEGHVSFGLASLLGWNWGVAERELRRGIDLNPNLAVAHREYGIYLVANGRLDEALAEARITKELDPLSAMSSLLLANVYYYQREYDAALKEYQNLIQISPTSAVGQYGLSGVFQSKFMFKESAAALSHGFRLDGDSQHANLIDESYKRGGQRAVSEAIIQINASPVSYDPYAVAVSYDFLGNKDQALVWLDKAYRARLPSLLFLKVDPMLDGIRSDPRYADLLRRIGLPQ